MKDLIGFAALLATIASLAFAGAIAARGLYEVVLLGWGLFG